MPKYENWVDEFEWAPDSAHIYFTSNVDGASPVMVFRPQWRYGEFFSTIGTLGDLHPLPDNHTVLCSWNTVQRPSEIISLSTEILSKREEKVADHFAKILHSTAPTTKLQFKQVTNLNGRLLVQLDVSHIENFRFHSRRWDEAARVSDPAAGIRCVEEISGEVFDSWRAAGALGRRLELSLERGNCLRRMVTWW